VFALNLFYDVAVKLHSLHYLAAALVLAAPDLGRLFGLLVQGKSSAALAAAGPAFTSSRMLMVAAGAKSLFVLYVGWGAYQHYQTFREIQARWPATPSGYRLIDQHPSWVSEDPYIR
jgi:hypothetical protein